jgi:hypothetical protein
LNSNDTKKKVCKKISKNPAELFLKKLSCRLKLKESRWKNASPEIGLVKSRPRAQLFAVGSPQHR